MRLSDNTVSLTQATKRCTERSFFFRVELIINDAAELFSVHFLGIFAIPERRSESTNGNEKKKT